MSPALVDHWIKDVSANEINDLVDAVNTCPGSPQKVFESWSSKAAIVSLVKLYLRKLPSK